MNRKEMLAAIKTAIEKDEEVSVFYSGGYCNLNNETTEMIEESLTNFWIIAIGNDTYFKDELLTEEHWSMQLL